MPEEVKSKVETFFGDYSLRKYSKGQVLLLSGDHADHVSYLVKGQVKVYDVNYRGDEVVLNVFQPPAFFPMSQAINPKAENPYIYEAESDIELRQAPSGAVVEFLMNNPDVMLNLLSRLYSGVDGLLGRMSHLMSGSALSRLVYEMIIETRRFGELQKDGSYIINTSEKSIGARAGLSRETVSREMKKLKVAGIIEVTGGHLVVRDFSGLQEKLIHAV